MVPQWEQINALLGGAEMVRAASRRFMSQHEYESDKRYADRLASNTLFNMTKKVLESWVGKPFSGAIHYSKETPEQILEWGEDIDLQGNNMAVFLRQWFREGLAKAFAPVMVEMPRLATPEGRVRSAADDVAEGVRPYWVHVRPENVIYAEAHVVNGRETLTHVRIREVVQKMDGFAEVLEERIRVYNAGDAALKIPTKVTVYRRVEKKDRKKGDLEWIPVGPPIELGVTFIPLVTFYADRDGVMRGTSPLLDLAGLNIRWWQSNSDQISCLTVARFPILAVSGGTDEDQVLKIGPYQYISIPDPTGRAYYVEHSGQALESGRKELLDLEEQMASYAVEMMKRRPANTTATGRVLDNREATSPLEDAAIRFNDAVAQALGFTAIYGELPEGGEVEINTEFALSKGDVEAYELLKEARRNMDISREKFFEEAMRLGAVDEEFDYKENVAQLEKEKSFLPEPAAPAPAAKPKPKPKPKKE
jgi:hypothetical protein